MYFSESQRMKQIQTPMIPHIAALIRQNPGTISLGQGIVNYPPPDSSFEEIAQFHKHPENHVYGPVQGIEPLCKLIKAKLLEENNINLDLGYSVIVTGGANMGFLNSLLAIADPNDEIILNVPYYFNQEMAIRMVDCKPVLVATDDNYQLQPELIKQAITPRTRAVVTISPNNPTGVVYSEASLTEVNEICYQHGIYHICDEAYENFTFDRHRHFSPASLPAAHNHTISLYSLSKAYGFASWRIGYMVIPEHLFMAILKVQDTNLICPPLISQHAAIGALKSGSTYCRAQLGDIAEVREIVLEELKTLDERCTIPATGGAFYVFIKVHTSLSDMELVERLIVEHRVAVIPGNTFGKDQGCYLRIAYAFLEKEAAREGIKRLVNGIKAIIE